MAMAKAVDLTRRLTPIAPSACGASCTKDNGRCVRNLPGLWGASPHFCARECNYPAADATRTMDRVHPRDMTQHAGRVEHTHGSVVASEGASQR
jgi:hypothetical protein